jgi:hypothetical protein
VFKAPTNVIASDSGAALPASRTEGPANLESNQIPARSGTATPCVEPSRPSSANADADAGAVYEEVAALVVYAFLFILTQADTESKDAFKLGAYKASWNQKHSRWQISDATGCIGGRTTRKRCCERMEELFSKSSAPAAPIPPAPAPTRQSTRTSAPAPPREKRKGNYKPGPGRGHKKPLACPVATAIAAAQTVVMFPASVTKAETVKVLGQMVGVTKSLKRKLDDVERQRDVLATLLLDKFGVHGDLATQEIKRRRTEILSSLGSGYSTEITFKHHRAHALAVLKDMKYKSMHSNESV